MRVFVYPEKVYEELGARRWHISWEQLKDGLEIKPGQDVDFDSDIYNVFAAYKTKDAATKAAKRILKSGKPYFGAITLTEQVVDWFVEEDRIAEWRDCGQPEEIN